MTNDRARTASGNGGRPVSARHGAVNSGAANATREAADLAHHLKNRLTAILGFCDLMLDEDAGAAAGGQRNDLVALRDNARKAATLVQRLLADTCGGYARRGGNGDDVDGQARDGGVIEVRRRLRALTPTLRRMAAPRARVVVEVDEVDDAVVRMASEDFEQVLFNLVSNAADASPPEGTVHVRARRIDAAADNTGRRPWIAIDITDTGAGIPEALRARVFEPFVTGKTNSGGSGIGLAIVREAVEAAGGGVDLSSVDGLGTTVTVRLPLRGELRTPGAHVAPAPGAERGAKDLPPGTRVLLVDDEEPTRTVAARALRRAGCDVVEAADGDRALALLDQASRQGTAPFDLLVTDVAMPVVDGWALADRARGRFPNLPIILTSGYVPDRAARAVVGTRFLSKPFSLDALLATVGAAVGDPGPPSTPVSADRPVRE